MNAIIPAPVSITNTGNIFTLSADGNIYIEPATPEMNAIGQYLADVLNPATGYGMRVLPAGSVPAVAQIRLSTTDADPALGDEGYELTVTEQGVSLSACQPAGLFRGVQTLRQLLPPEIEQSTVQAGPWSIDTGFIRDYPRFGWRGMMLDVSRHFFGVQDVKRLIDLLAYYKLNRLHLHLTDDQGWRLMIDSWPKLTTVGGSTAVGGGPGGFYTQADYAEIVAYAQSRHIMVVPEIDLPGHTNAALAAYPELNCDEQAPPLYTEIEVGFSSLCINKEITYRFVDDVIREVAALTPGSYLHIGGDEALSTDKEEYIAFIARVQEIVRAHGKQMIGWEEIAQADLDPSSVAQHWHDEQARKAVEQGVKVIMSPGAHAYLDMKYDDATPLGLDWAGTIEVDKAYDWDPATHIPGVTEADILGVESPLWTETVETIADIDTMTFPRLLGLAEIGWSPATGRSWDEYRQRLAAHGPRLAALGVHFYRSPLVQWR